MYVYVWHRPHESLSEGGHGFEQRGHPEGRVFEGGRSIIVALVHLQIALYVCECMYVCMYTKVLCMYVHKYMYEHMYAYTTLYVCMCVCMYEYTYVCVYACIYVYTSICMCKAVHIPYLCPALAWSGETAAPLPGPPARAHI